MSVAPLMICGGQRQRVAAISTPDLCEGGDAGSE